MIVALAGGVGGAKLARGLAKIAGADLSVIVDRLDEGRRRAGETHRVGVSLQCADDECDVLI